MSNAAPRVELMNPSAEKPKRCEFRQPAKAARYYVALPAGILPLRRGAATARRDKIGITLRVR
jgi:hypothetical protein